MDCIFNNNNYNASENMKIYKRIVIVIIILIITQVRRLGDRYLLLIMYATLNCY